MTALVNSLTGELAPDHGSELRNVASHLRSERLSNALELLIDSATEYAICMLDPQGCVVIWNKGAERLFGWTEAEAVGRNHAIFFPPDAIAAGKPGRHLARAFSQGSLDDRGWRARKDGSLFLASATLTSIRDTHGCEIGFGKLVRDVTREQAFIDAVEAREVHLQSILATIPDAMVVSDEDGIILSFSAAAVRLFGYAPGEALGRNVTILMNATDHVAHNEYIAQYRATGAPRIIGVGRRVIGRHKDGSPVPLQISIGEAVGGGKHVFTAFLRDQTGFELAQGRLRDVQNELLHITRVGAMGAMASTLAHELNQPLTAVANYLHASRNLLKAVNEPAIATVQEALDVAESEVLRAGQIVRRLREFVARGETEKCIVSVETLIADSCLLGLAGARAQGIVSRVELAPGLSRVFIDQVLIQQVMINLLCNAVQALGGDGGEVLITAGNDGAFVRITVADTGPGVPAEVRDRLFEAFVSTKSTGMGLGLSICRTIVESHGGRIWYEAVPQGGAAFHFTVPVADVEAGA